MSCEKRIQRGRPDPFAWINNTYGLNVKRGMRVEYAGQPGTVTGTNGGHLLVRLDGDKHSRHYHPTWNIKYPGILTRASQGG